MVGMEEGETKVLKMRGVWVIFVKAGLVGNASSCKGRGGKQAPRDVTT